MLTCVPPVLQLRVPSREASCTRTLIFTAEKSETIPATTCHLRLRRTFWPAARRSADERGADEQSRPDATSGGANDRAAFADYRRDCGCGCDRGRCLSAHRIFPWLSAELYGVARDCARVDGDSYAPPSHQGRVGNDYPPHSGCGHAHAAAARTAIHPVALRTAPAIPVGETAR